jgi:hypothetical protein
MPKQLTVSDVARSLGVAPRAISDLFYARRLDDRRCPILGGRRLIPAEYVNEIRRVVLGATQGEGEVSRARKSETTLGGNP